MSSSLLTRFGLTSIMALATVSACSGSDKGVADPQLATGGSGFGSAVTGGSANMAKGGASTGGTNATGGAATGGAATGGAATGGATTGGAATGGAATGGAKATGGSSTQTGGSNTGGATTGGTSNGGAGGSATGGRTAGGSSTGGSRAGGAGGVGGSATGGKSVGGSTNGGSTVGGSSIGGSATGGASTTPGSDGCSNTLALGLTMSEIAIFQTGKISIMKGGSEVTATTTYGADVVEGKQTMFRVYVTTDSGFQSRQLSARLTLNDGSTPYYAKQTIAASSTELSATNSFQIVVPASEIKSGLNYSIEIVECATGSGTAHNPRFPSNGSANVTTRATGKMNVTLIPITAGGITPTLDSLATNLKGQLESLYPTNLAQIAVATTPITGCNLSASTAVDGTTWSNCLQLVRSRRSSDKPSSDMYYVGIVTPATTYRTYCGSGCIAGVGYVATTASAATARALVAIGYEPYALMTIAHELGHNHGLEHSPGCGADEADAAFPYVTNGTARIGWVGWDSRAANTFIDPAKYTDLMAYCDPVWVSDYVYSKLGDRVAALNGSALWLGDGARATWRVLDVANGQASWGAPITEPTPAFGDPVSGTVLDVNGNALLEISAYRTRISNGLGAMYLVPEPAANWAQLRIGSTQIAFQ